MSIEIDWDGVKSLIRWEKVNSCVDCNVKVRILNDKRCNPCHFSPASGQRKHNPNFFSTGIQPKTVFRQYGVPESWGKSQLFYFLYYPELNNELPMPDVIYDIYEQPVEKDNIHWIIHHMNRQNWNDHIWNILACLRHEHPFFEKLDNQFNQRIFNIYKNL